MDICSFFLLPDKSTNTYATAFRCIIKTCSAQNLYFNPTTIVADLKINENKKINQ
jgi:hypothetical protein